MPGPAARIGDQTAHGGAITKGEFMVLIGGKPAARVTDTQACPMMSGTVAHGSTPIMPPGQTMVLIGGLPAATMGDICAPPCGASIISGDMTVLIGTSPGGVGPAVGFAAPGAQAAANAANAACATTMSASSSATAASSAGAQENENEQKTSWIEIELLEDDNDPVVDEEYKITLPDGSTQQGRTDGNGRAKIENIDPGICKVTFPNLDKDAWGLAPSSPPASGVVSEREENKAKEKIVSAEWSVKEAKCGEKVKVDITTENVDEGSSYKISIFEKDQNGSDDHIETITGEVKDNKIEEKWKFKYIDDSDDMKFDLEYQHPEYYFKVKINNQEKESGLLVYKNWVEFNFVDYETQDPLANEEYIIVFSNDEMRMGKLDCNGYGKEEDIPVGTCQIILLSNEVEKVK